MNNFITRICSIKNHPIKYLDYPFKVKYLKGLGGCLSKFTDNKKQIESLYKALCLSIIDNEPDSSWLKAPDIKDISRALGIQRNGFRFFTMRKELMFDCFNFLSIVCEKDCEQMYEWLRKEYCDIFTRSLLKKVYIYLKDGINEDIIPRELLEHKKQCDNYQSQREKQILVVANVSAGKSTLINALVGCRINKAKTTACTSKLCYIYNKPVEDGILSHNHIRNEYFYTNIFESITSDVADKISLKFNSTFGNQKICLIDSPGFNNIDDATHRKTTEDAIKSNAYDAVIYVSNCQYFGTTDEHNLLELLKKNAKKPIIFVLNQLDRFKQKEDSIGKMMCDYYADLIKIGFESPIIIPISAQAGLLFKLSDSLLDDDDLYDKEKLKSKFQKEYYNLQSYTSQKKADATLLECSGISCLEKAILQI